MISASSTIRPQNFVLKKSVLKKGQIFRPLFSGQIFRPDFGPQDEIIRPGMTFCPPDVLLLLVHLCKKISKKSPLGL